MLNENLIRDNETIDFSHLDLVHNHGDFIHEYAFMQYMSKLQNQEEKKFTELFEDILENRKQINKNTNDISGLKPKVEKNTNDISELKPKVNQNTNNITDLTDKVSKLKEPDLSKYETKNSASKELTELKNLVNKVINNNWSNLYETNVAFLGTLKDINFSNKYDFFTDLDNTSFTNNLQGSDKFYDLIFKLEERDENGEHNKYIVNDVVDILIRLNDKIESLRQELEDLKKGSN